MKVEIFKDLSKQAVVFIVNHLQNIVSKILKNVQRSEQKQAHMTTELNVNQT